MDEDQRAELRESFEHFDRNGDGQIDFAEFVELVRVMSGRAGQAELRIGFEETDEDGNGRIDFEEFCDWWQAAGR